VGVDSVKLADGFWAPRLDVNRRRMLPSQYEQCEKTGRLENFARAAGRPELPFHGPVYNDSDVYKWLEAACWTLAGGTDPALVELVEKTAAAITAAQQPDGYLNTAFMYEKAGERWANLRDMHELYCAGHFIQAAVAHCRATGGDKLLATARKLADCICSVFGEGVGKRPGAPGHEEIEMALVELARQTGEERYLEQAEYFINARGKGIIGGSHYHQDHVPFRELNEVTGHAVRALYLACGAADVLAETGDASIAGALHAQWDNFVTRRMYVTGGAGARYEGEAFGKDYELPNERAYAETCAAIASFMWNWRMLLAEGEAKYADCMETALYNGTLSGVSLDGDAYFYQNPLADDGTHRREAWFGTACCPPNVSRTLASLPGYFYGVSPEGLWAHLYASNEAEAELPDGRKIPVVQKTRYPWDGDVELEVNGGGGFGLMLRIPGWCGKGASISVNGKAHRCTVKAGTYAAVKREWKPGDKVRLSLPMPGRLIEAHPHVFENAGRVALARGPLVYCVEEVDNPRLDVRGVGLKDAGGFSAVFEPDVLGGTVVLKGEASVEPAGEDWRNALYREARARRRKSPPVPVELAAVPYYAWANRKACRMQVWLRKS